MSHNTPSPVAGTPPATAPAAPAPPAAPPAAPLAAAAALCSVTTTSPSTEKTFSPAKAAFGASVVAKPAAAAPKYLRFKDIAYLPIVTAKRDV